MQKKQRATPKGGRAMSAPGQAWCCRLRVSPPLQEIAHNATRRVRGSGFLGRRRRVLSRLSRLDCAVWARSSHIDLLSAGRYCRLQ
jgi:hypothetical protein